MTAIFKQRVMKPAKSLTDRQCLSTERSVANATCVAKVMLGCISQSWHDTIKRDLGLDVVVGDPETAELAWRRSRDALETAREELGKLIHQSPYKPLTLRQQNALSRELRSSDSVTRRSLPDLKFFLFDLSMLLASQAWVNDHFVADYRLRNENDWIRYCLGDRHLASAAIKPDGTVQIPMRRRYGAYVDNVIAKRTSNDEIEVITRVRSTQAYMRVAKFKNYYVLLNGHHRAVNLLSRGHRYAICVLDSDALSDSDGLGQGDMHRFEILRHYLPRISAFLNTDIAPAITVRLKEHLFALRTAVKYTEC